MNVAAVNENHQATVWWRILLASWLLGCGGSTDNADPADGEEQRNNVAAARVALREERFADAFKSASQVLTASPDWPESRLIAGEAASRLGDTATAIQTYLELATARPDSENGQLALFSAADVCLHAGRLSEAETYYRRVLEFQPANAVTHERLAFLLSISGRRWESRPHYMQLVRSGTATWRELALAADLGRPAEQVEFIAGAAEAAPEDPLTQLAVLYEQHYNGETVTADSLHNLVNEHPHWYSAHALLGELLVTEADRSEFLQWNSALPPESSNAADIWFSRGLWARAEGDLAVAASCFRQAVLIEPCHRRAFYQLGQALAAREAPDAERVIKYASQLMELSRVVDEVLRSEARNDDAVRRTAELLIRLGRIWEACAWAVEGRRLAPQAAWPEQIFASHADRLQPELAAVIRESVPVKGEVLRDIPGFNQLLTRSANSTSGRPAERSTDLGPIRFRSETIPQFVYFNGADEASGGARMFEQTGGGVAVIDIDLDGAPDLFLPQGLPWPVGAKAPAADPNFRDALLRNRIGRFEPTGNTAGLDDFKHFGQGATVGDFNQDGFPDLYVGNIGENLLYLNQGDGTFEVSAAALPSSDLWTSSVMMRDLNGDGFPELCDINYLTGNDVYEKVCEGRGCSPVNFPGAPNRFLISKGDGSVIASEPTMAETQSRGLGVVSFCSATDRSPVIFIANDQVANYFLKVTGDGSTTELTLRNEAVLNGLAYNNDGLAMACMGIAVEDFDGNGHTDIFVTNFQDEANTLYLQDAPGLFIDHTKSAGLYGPSLPWTGWGTQALDADLDGLADLVVTNGHVDDYTDVGGDYEMRPQFYRNLGNRFAELTDNTAGDWFTNPILGRGLARLDWNLDGLPDFAVSAMNSDAALLTNETGNTGNFLRISLTADESERDAFGALVKVTCGERVFRKELVAGNGYMASNERILHFGLGLASEADEVAVTWPSGNRTALRQVRTNSTWKISEHCGGRVLPSPAVSSKTTSESKP